jgi:transcriptional regulator with XRE-family HTH domain
VPGVPRQPDPPWIIEERQRLGVRVREAREYANLTQEGLEERSGVKRLTLQRIESGSTDARISWLIRIAHALGLPVTEFLPQSRPPGPPNRRAEP